MDGVRLWRSLCSSQKKNKIVHGIRSLVQSADVNENEFLLIFQVHSAGMRSKALDCTLTIERKSSAVILGLKVANHSRRQWITSSYLLRYHQRASVSSPRLFLIKKEWIFIGLTWLRTGSFQFVSVLTLFQYAVSECCTFAPNLSERKIVSALSYGEAESSLVDEHTDYITYAYCQSGRWGYSKLTQSGQSTG